MPVFINGEIFIFCIFKKTEIFCFIVKFIIADNDAEYWLYNEYKGNISKLTRSLSVRKVDLNKDGDPEYLVQANSISLCGTCGCLLWIYQKHDNSYRALHPLDGDNVCVEGLDDMEVKLLPTYTNGYADIQCSVRDYDPAERQPGVILKFNGTRYERSSK